MATYVLKRLALSFVVLFCVSVITFALVRLAGDPAVAVAGQDATEAELEAVRVAMGFNRPLAVQYVEWLGRVASGDLGYSNILRRPVLDVMVERIPVTATLAGLSLLVAVSVAFPLGILSALHPNSWIDRLSLSLAVVGQALPNFFFGLMLIMAFAVTFRWFPVSGDSGLRSFVLPAIALGYSSAPPIMRLIRSGMIEVLESDYIRTARAMGLARHRIVLRHALRNAVLPVVSLMAVQLGFMLSGSIIVETVFSMNGLGRLGWQSIQRTDLEMMQALVMVISMVYLVLILLADILNGYLDPRIRIR
ncbi:MAG: ABC transporter permease [Rhodobacteraceae bacterium]|nr:ABC transporter permease [Paracoccaceae bacterium]